MGSPFLLAFAEAVLASLAARGLVELEAGARSTVAGFVAERLAASKEGDSLIRTLSRALLDAPGLVELFADDEDLKEVVTELPRASLPSGGAR